MLWFMFLAMALLSCFPSKTVALNVLLKHCVTSLRASKRRNVVIAEHTRQILLRLQ